MPPNPPQPAGFGPGGQLSQMSGASHPQNVDAVEPDTPEGHENGIKVHDSELYPLTIFNTALHLVPPLPDVEQRLKPKHILPASLLSQITFHRSIPPIVSSLRVQVDHGNTVELSTPPQKLASASTLPSSSQDLSSPPPQQLKEQVSTGLDRSVSTVASDIIRTSDSLTRQVDVLRLGNMIGTGGTWDVYELLDRPGQVLKICNPYGVLETYNDSDLTVETVMSDLVNDTTIPMSLAASGHVPLIYGLWLGSLQLRDGEEAEFWSLVISIQEDVRYGGQFEALTKWEDLDAERRSEIADWFLSLHDQGFTHGDPEPRHCFVEKGGGRGQWKIVDWGRGTVRASTDAEEWEYAVEKDTVDVDLVRRVWSRP